MIFTKPVRIGTIGNGGQGERIYSVNGKSITLSANGGGRGAKTGLYRIGTIGKGNRGEVIYNIKGKSITLTAGGGVANTGQYVITDDKDIKINAENIHKIPIRKLYPIECERLQTIPDNYTEGFSNSARYKMIGNSFTTDVITHILSFVKHLNPTRVKLNEKYKQILMTF